MIIFRVIVNGSPVTRKASWIILLLAMLQWRCIETYVSPYKSPATGYLVVEGYVTGNGPTYFRLTRTIALPGDSLIPVVLGADLQIEGNDNSIFPFTETGNGYYVLPSIGMNTATRYRLRISNVNGESYVSDFVPFKPTPPIDSLNWMVVDTGVDIYVSAHDPGGNTRYYQWKVIETWEYTSAEGSGWIFQGDSLAVRPTSAQIYYCYRTDSSANILVGSSAKLAQDVIYEAPVITIPDNDQRLGIEYSALVSQYSLTDSAFQYLTELKGNTEQLGSVFDPMPTQLTGNIHCIGNSSEPVIGYISAGTVQQQRIFINRLQVPNWLYFPECADPNKTFVTKVDTMTFYFDYLHYIPISVPNTGVVTAGEAYCVDCRLQGGTTQKPAFMP